MRAAFSPILLALVLGLIAVLTTSLDHLLVVPPTHFDEAWSGHLAFRIVTEPQFWPTEGMNSYTLPVIPYFLAGAFKIFGTSTAVTRTFFLGLNLIVFGMVGLLVRNRAGIQAVTAFSFLFALLPISVFDQRNQVEVTSWFALCYALCLLGIDQILSGLRSVGVWLLGAGFWLGTLSHILFFIVPFSLWTVYALMDFSPTLSRKSMALLFIPLSLLPIRMGLELRDPFPFLVALAFVGMGAWNPVWQPWRKLTRSRWFQILIALPMLAAAFIYFLFEFNGAWPYAQITGELRYFWIPINVGLLALLLYWTKDELAQLKSCLGLFVVQMTLTGWAVLKPTSAKYWMIPTLTLIVIMSLFWARLEKKAPLKALAWISAFALWNFFIFRHCFIDQYVLHGAHRTPFSVGRIADSARYSRPAEPAYQWLKQRGCHQTPITTDDGRLQYVVDYLQELDRATPVTKPICEGSFYFGHPNSAPPGFARVPNSPIWPDLEIWTK